jgi:hypothetical protein
MPLPPLQPGCGAHGPRADAAGPRNRSNFDPVSYIAALRAAGVTVAPCHLGADWTARQPSNMRGRTRVGRAGAASLPAARV